MGTRGETTVETGAALLHHHSHLLRNHIYHVTTILDPRPSFLSCNLSSLAFHFILPTEFHSMCHANDSPIASTTITLQTSTLTLNFHEDTIFRNCLDISLKPF